MQLAHDVVASVRDKIGSGLYSRVAGPNASSATARIHDAPGPRWFDENRPIRRVHGDASMFIGGLRALLLQSLHPLTMAAVAQFSDYRDDPWGRLQRTAGFIAETTYGTAADSQQAVDRVREIHHRIKGTAPDGRSFYASDPHLLLWVHVAEVDSFLRCHQRYGAQPLSPAECDAYVADTARIATALGAATPPLTRSELGTALADFRHELRGTSQARTAARFLIWNPPLPLLARGPYGVLAAAAIAEMPMWTRRQLLLPYLPVSESTFVPVGGHALVRTIRWALQPATT